MTPHDEMREHSFAEELVARNYSPLRMVCGLHMVDRLAPETQLLGSVRATQAPIPS
jgi:hypothetical protein